MHVSFYKCILQNARKISLTKLTSILLLELLFSTRKMIVIASEGKLHKGDRPFHIRLFRRKGRIACGLISIICRRRHLDLVPTNLGCCARERRLRGGVRIMERVPPMLAERSARPYAATSSVAIHEEGK